MKRRVLSFLTTAAVAMTATLAACGDDAEPAPAVAPPAATSAPAEPAAAADTAPDEVAAGIEIVADIKDFQHRSLTVPVGATV